MTLKRTTGLKRTAFARSDAKEASAVAKIRAKRCAVKTCRQPFTPDRPFITWCSPDCGTAVALAKVARLKVTQDAARKRAARAERVEDKAKLEKHKRRADYIAEAQKAFNAFIRFRDRDQPCICCGRAETGVTGLHTHGWDCGHYRSRGSAPHLRFDERNAHRQLVYCNRNRGGNATDYRIGLIARIGLQAVEELESDQTPRDHSIEALKAIKAAYVAKLKDARK